MADRTNVTDAELAVLRVLWDRSGATIRRLADTLYPGGTAAHYSTVQKLLDRLEAKGFVTRRPDGRANVYSARVNRSELIARRLRETAEKLCSGSLTPLLTQLIESSELSAEELCDLRAAVDRLDREPRRR